MPWFWWGGKSQDDDPTKSLDPSLKEFLKEQQPRPYKPVEPNPQPTSQPEEKQVQAVLPDTNAVYEGRPVPQESLYQDGRYADLWKTYTPQGAIDAATTSQVDRHFNDYNDRRKAIAQAALENCSFEAELRQQCLDGFAKGSLAEKVKAAATLCSDERKQWNRCYQLQAKFLQALGYFADKNSSLAHQEKIQMHADKLYHRMMDYEADVEDAKANGRPIPPLTSIFNPDQPAPTLEQIQIPEGLEARMQRPLRDYPAQERELRAQAALTEAKIRVEASGDRLRYASTMASERQHRQDTVAGVMGQPVAKFVIPDIERKGQEQAK